MSSHTLRFLLLVLSFFFLSMQAREFLYPVAVLDHDGAYQLYLLYQKSTMHIELWLWDPQVKTVCKGLLSSYTPAGLKILPSKNGFSFIDNGRVRIKFFEKRSPRSLEIYESLYNISTIEWINDAIFYLGAKKGDNYGIFQISSEGDVQTLVAYNGIDCMYPQKVGNMLFYIERSKDPQHYQLMCVPYPTISHRVHDFNNTDDFENQVAAIIFGEEEENKCPIVKQRQKILVHDAGDSPMIFLQMIGPKEGFYIEHQGLIERRDKIVTFKYHQIKKRKGQWKSSYLFSFSVPAHLILPTSDLRLHESILPLVPRHNDETIYFSDCSKRTDGLGLDLFRYYLPDKSLEQVSFGKGDQQFFSPLVVGNELFYGGSLEGGKLPGMWISQEGQMDFDLPRVDCN